MAPKYPTRKSSIISDKAKRIKFKLEAAEYVQEIKVAALKDTRILPFDEREIDWIEQKLRNIKFPSNFYENFFFASLGILATAIAFVASLYSITEVPKSIWIIAWTFLAASIIAILLSLVLGRNQKKLFRESIEGIIADLEFFKSKFYFPDDETHEKISLSD